MRFDRSAAMDYAVANTSDLAHCQVAEDLRGAVAGGCGCVAAALTDLSAFDPQNPPRTAARRRQPASRHTKDRDV